MLIHPANVISFIHKWAECVVWIRGGRVTRYFEKKMFKILQDLSKESTFEISALPEYYNYAISLN